MTADHLGEAAVSWYHTDRNDPDGGCVEDGMH